MLLATLENSLHAAYLQVQITKPEVIHSFLMFIMRVQAASMSS